MTDWVAISRRTVVYVMIAGILWLGGAWAGIVSAKTNDPYDLLCDVLLFSMFALSIAMIAYSATKCPSHSALRLGWFIVAIAFTVAFGATGHAVLGNLHTPQINFNGDSFGITLGLAIAGCGLWVGASSVSPDQRNVKPLLQALGLCSFLFVVMAAALLAPGPSMPFSIGPRDGTGMGRLLIDFALLLLPTAYATLAQLRLPNAHRARAWMWASAGALMMVMADVVNPLVDQSHGQIYPIMLWCLGIIQLTVAALLTADFEIAEQSAREPVPVEADPAPQPLVDVSAPASL